MKIYILNTKIIDRGEVNYYLLETFINDGNNSIKKNFFATKDEYNYITQLLKTKEVINLPDYCLKTRCSSNDLVHYLDLNSFVKSNK